MLVGPEMLSGVSRSEIVLLTCPCPDFITLSRSILNLLRPTWKRLSPLHSTVHGLVQVYPPPLTSYCNRIKSSQHDVRIRLIRRHPRPPMQASRHATSTLHSVPIRGSTATRSKHSRRNSMHHLPNRRLTRLRPPHQLLHQLCLLPLAKRRASLSMDVDML